VPVNRIVWCPRAKNTVPGESASCYRKRLRGVWSGIRGAHASMTRQLDTPTGAIMGVNGALKVLAWMARAHTESQGHNPSPLLHLNRSSCSHLSWCKQGDVSVFVAQK